MLREGSFALACFGRVRKVHETALAVAFGRKSVVLKRIMDAAFESPSSPGEVAFADLMDVLLAIAITPISFQSTRCGLVNKPRRGLAGGEGGKGNGHEQSPADGSATRAGIGRQLSPGIAGSGVVVVNCSNDMAIASMRSL
ncbi:MAG TPA: hypothetical protein VGX78_06320 [Pirellulales bacterium]|nr:hypothetical protein [Pirellulales bacterium]